MITNLTGTPVASLLEPNGDILVRLFNGTTATVARFLPSGALDTSFGSGGVAQTAISGSAELPLDGSGKVLVGSGIGSTSNTLAFVVERLNPNGQPDPTFGSNGVASANSSGKSATCLLVQPDGKVLIGGDRIQTRRPEKEFGLIMRFNSDGTLDTAFGNAGQVNLSSNGTGVEALGLDASGDIFALGAGPQTELSPAGQVDANLTPAPLTTISKGDHLLASSLTANDQSLLRETVHTGGRGASQSFEAQIAVAPRPEPWIRPSRARHSGLPAKPASLARTSFPKRSPRPAARSWPSAPATPKTRAQPASSAWSALTQTASPTRRSATAVA